MAAQTTPAVPVEAQAVARAARGRPVRRRRERGRRYYALLGAVSVIVLVSLWQVLVSTGVIPKLFMPAPTDVAKQGWKFIADGTLAQSVVDSTRRVLVGFALASAAAVPLGVLFGTSRLAKALFDPILSLIRPLPSLAWIPLSILWFGIDETQKYMIVFMGTFASALLFSIEATRRVDPLLIKAARNLGASDLAVMREVVLPGALPGIISGLKVCLALSWTTVLSAEMVAATSGLGALIWTGKDWNNMNIVLVGMAAISLTVLLIDSLFKLVEDHILPWERSRQRR